MKYIVSILALLLSDLSFAKIELLQPPQINDIQKEKFIKWKKDYLMTVDTAEKQKDKSRIATQYKLRSLYINELIYSHSPYLKQHAHNPVNWKPWSSIVLEQAKKNNKLIFLSIGYSTCHWCHVMEKESFNDFDVASTLNESYLAIKVDREELPHIDDYYASALEHVKGSAGWPISAIINSDGLPVFIDSYLSKDKLIKLLLKVDDVWQQQPEFLLTGARNIDSLVRNSFKASRKSIGQEYNVMVFNQKLLAELDPVSGGFKGEIKFPDAALLLYMLDQLKREPNKKLQKILKLQLDQMISGGLHDHIEGGFHRYSTDSSWTVPHFEKMLYNQALLIEVYAQAYEYFYDKKYLKVVATTVNFIIENFYIENKGFASAMDADFKGEEGGYYLWSQAELNLFKNKQPDIYSSLLKTYSFVNGNKSSKKLAHNQRNLGVLLPALPHGSSNYSIFNLRKQLVLNRKSRGSISLDEKVLTGWNGLAIKSLVTAGQLLNRKELTNIANRLAEQLWTERYQLSTNLISRTGFESKSITREITQSHLEDYAYLADAYIHLYDINSQEHWLEKALLITSAVMKYFVDIDGGFYNVSDRKNQLTLKKSADTELLAASSVMFDVLYKLNRRLGGKALSKKYPNIVNNMTSKVIQKPLNHLYGLLTLNQNEQGSTFKKRYFASGKGQLIFNCQDYFDNVCLEISIELKLLKGWHINSNKPLQEYLVPTKIIVPNGFNVSYPNDKIVKLGFQKKELSVFDGQFRFMINRNIDTKEKMFFELPLQACDDTVCMLPEIIKFHM